MTSKRKSLEAFIHRMRRKGCKFDDTEFDSLVELYNEMVKDSTKGKLERTKFRDILQEQFRITDDFLMDRVFRAFDRDNDGYLNLEEWTWGLHVFLKGDLEEQIKYCFLVYDLNGDGHISRDEMFNLLKSCLIKSSTEEDPDEGVKDLVEIMLKKLNRCTIDDFREAVNQERLLLEGLGHCIPCDKARIDFLALLQGNLSNLHGMRAYRTNDSHKGHSRGMI